MSNDNLRKGLINESYDDLESFIDTPFKEEQKTAREQIGCFGKYSFLVENQQTIQPLSSKEKSQFFYEKFKNTLLSLKREKYTFLKHYSRNQKRVYITLFWLVLSVAASVVIPIMIKNIIDYISNQVVDYTNASTIICLIIISRAINMISNAQARLEIEIKLILNQRSFGFDAQNNLDPDGKATKSDREKLLNDTGFQLRGINSIISNFCNADFIVSQNGANLSKWGKSSFKFFKNSIIKQKFNLFG